jgi:hypothetical protein
VNGISRTVPDTAVRGAVEGVKLLVYSAVPLTNRRFETYPTKKEDDPKYDPT